MVGFGTDSQGELLIVDYGGGLYQLAKTPESQQPKTEFPIRLSETGLFASVQDHRMHPALIPYSVNAPLWSDGADKDRWIALPDETRMQFKSKGGWEFSDAAVLVKTFSLELEKGVTASRRRIETRLLTRQQGQWHGYTYVWNDEQTDAALVESSGRDVKLVIRDSAVPGGERVQTWRLPSRAECMVCHSRAANFVLGLSVLQMNRRHDYGTTSDNQLKVLKQLGVFTGDTRPGNPQDHSRLVDPYDARADLTMRARSYLHANCSQCHVVAGGGNSQINLAFAASLAGTKLIDTLPQHRSFGVPGTTLVKPGHPNKSILYQRTTRRGKGQMPPLATSLVDRRGAQLLFDWINSLSVRSDVP